jgi:hypothetical protein
MEFDALRAQFDQATIGRNGLVVASAIAEHPGANAQHRRVAADPRHGAPAAFDRFIAPASVEERFGEAAIRPRIRRDIAVCSGQIGKTRV